jgi:phospholipase/carboxylesterase
MLHGQGGDEDAMWVFATVVPSDWVVVAARGPEPEAAGGYAWRHVASNEWPNLDAFDTAASSVLRLVRALPTVYGTDPARTYLMGFSQGAATAYATALAAPGLVAGIAGLVGFLPTPPRETLERRPLAGLPVFMAEGTRDRLVPPEISAACLAGLRAAGADVEHHAYPAAHKVTGRGRADLALWFAAREP